MKGPGQRYPAWRSTARADRLSRPRGPGRIGSVEDGAATPAIASSNRGDKSPRGRRRTPSLRRERHHAQSSGAPGSGRPRGSWWAQLCAPGADGAGTRDRVSRPRSRRCVDVSPTLARRGGAPGRNSRLPLGQVASATNSRSFALCSGVTEGIGSGLGLGLCKDCGLPQRGPTREPRSSWRDGGSGRWAGSMVPTGCVWTTGWGPPRHAAVVQTAAVPDDQVPELEAVHCLASACPATGSPRGFPRRSSTGGSPCGPSFRAQGSPVREAVGTWSADRTPATAASLTSCSYGLIHARDRPRSCER